MNQTLTSEHVLPSAVDSPLAGWELLTGSLESASVLCIDTDDRTLTALALGCRQLRILVRDADRAREVSAAAEHLGWTHVSAVIENHAPTDLAGLHADGLVINDVSPRGARGGALGSEGYLRRLLPHLRDGAFIVVLAMNPRGIGGGGGAGASGKATYRTLASGLQAAGLVSVEVHPALTGFDGELHEVVAECGYAPNRRQAALRENFKRLLWGKHGARWLAPAFVGTGWVNIAGTRVIDSILRVVGGGGPRFGWVQHTVLRGGKVILTVRSGTTDAGLVVVVTRNPLAIARREHEAQVLHDLKQRLPHALADLLPAPLGSPSIEGYRCFLLQHMPGVSSDAPVSGLDRITWQAAEFLLSLHDCTARTLRLTVDAWDRSLGAVFESARTRNPVVTVELEALEARVRALLLHGDWREVCCHGDFKIENVLYETRTLRISGVIDWEHCMPAGLPYIDLAYLLVYNTMIAGSTWFDSTRDLLEGALPGPLRVIESRYIDHTGTTRPMLAVLRALFVVHHIGCRRHGRWPEDEIPSLRALLRRAAQLLPADQQFTPFQSK